MNKSVCVRRNTIASPPEMLHSGLRESNWVLINVWSGKDPDSPTTPPSTTRLLPTLPKHHIAKPSPLIPVVNPLPLKD